MFHISSGFVFRALCWYMTSPAKNHLRTLKTGSATLRRWKSRYIFFVCCVFIYMTHLLKITFLLTATWRTAELFNHSFQHASSDVEKMILGNKCDMNDRRQVSKERGEKVRSLTSYKLLQYFTQIEIIILIIYNE